MARDLEGDHLPHLIEVDHDDVEIGMRRRRGIVGEGGDDKLLPQREAEHIADRRGDRKREQDEGEQ
jgi:hypothetical protein